MQKLAYALASYGDAKAEGTGFEPARAIRPLVFKTSALTVRRTPPRVLNKIFYHLKGCQILERALSGY